MATEAGRKDGVGEVMRQITQQNMIGAGRSRCPADSARNRAMAVIPRQHLPPNRRLFHGVAMHCLVVEDDPVIAAHVLDGLRAAGRSADHAATGGPRSSACRAGAMMPWCSIACCPIWAGLTC
jgi:hypothetical protein